MRTNIQALEHFSATLSSVLMGETFPVLAQQAAHQNPWFTEKSIRMAMEAWITALQPESITKWLEPYVAAERPKKVGLILAGNIPLVGLHDILSCLCMGHSISVKCSSDDQVLSKRMLSILSKVHPQWENRIEITERMQDVDAVIATGSNNSSRYFEYYFKDIPHIIRKNRHSVAVLSGHESEEQLQSLGIDIFSYFGLGCRNVSKLYLPAHFDLSRLFEAWENWRTTLLEHSRYVNNFEYNLAMKMVNREAHFTNNFLILTENEAFTSPVSVIHFSRYDQLSSVQQELSLHTDQIQCVVSGIASWPSAIAPGKSQTPELWEYADGVNTLDFLSRL
ncbi:MAG: acyl-CoA reductase [Bacteroidia bacterium]